MGEIVGAAIFGHQPGIMAPEPLRKAMGRGVDTTLVEPGMKNLRAALDAVRADTFVIFDTHWFTTIEHVIAGAPRFQGIYTSDELPTLISDYKYDYAGAPALAEAVAAAAKERGVRLLNATNPHIAQHYPTLNLLHYLHRGESVLSVGTCQTAEVHNYLELGAAIAGAVGRTPGARVALFGSGGMSHTFWPMDVILEHGSFRTDDLISPEARDIDLRILELWREGRHDAVIDLYPEYRRFHPEGFFAHYLILVGALGGRGCKAPGRRLSEYENAVGTGQVHVWFDLAGGAA
ncbi:MAG TPA: catechol 1,2-dioxygenase [Myxococcota bacterium]|jgi:3,4-dihydroxyphenylacetate 2,3-dioxygenase|nr:catechol 1,2-dioxygenase [Myxococcota bacterium]